MLSSVNHAVVVAEISIPTSNLAIAVVNHRQIGAVATGNQAVAVEGAAEIKSDQVAEGIGTAKSGVACGGKHHLLAVGRINGGILQAAELQRPKGIGIGPQGCFIPTGHFGATAHQLPATGGSRPKGQGIEVGGIGNPRCASVRTDAAIGGNPGVEISAAGSQTIAL